MPRAKRDQSVSLTKTIKRSAQATKHLLAAHVRATVNQHEFIYVFSLANMRTTQLKGLRSLWSDSRFFLGKTKVIQYGLGLNPESESSRNLHVLAKLVDPQSGLLFTDRPSHQVLSWFRAFKEEDFARAGNIATKTVNLTAGPMPQFSFAMEHHMRNLGMPTRLDCSRVLLTTDFTVCNRGDVLTPNQAKILKLLGIRVSIFRVTVKCYWNKGTGEIIYPPAEEYEPEPDLVQPVEVTPILNARPAITAKPEDFAENNAAPVLNAPMFFKKPHPEIRKRYDLFEF